MITSWAICGTFWLSTNIGFSIYLVRVCPLAFADFAEKCKNKIKGIVYIMYNEYRELSI